MIIEVSENTKYEVKVTELKYGDEFTTIDGNSYMVIRFPVNSVAIPEIRSAFVPWKKDSLYDYKEGMILEYVRMCCLDTKTHSVVELLYMYHPKRGDIPTVPVINRKTNVIEPYLQYRSEFDCTCTYNSKEKFRIRITSKKSGTQYYYVYDRKSTHSFLADANEQKICAFDKLADTNNMLLNYHAVLKTCHELEEDDE